MARVPAPERTRNELKAMFGGKSAVDRSSLVRQAARLIVEEALEGEATEVLGSGYYEHVATRRGEVPPSPAWWARPTTVERASATRASARPATEG
jgi:hypothetical protein